MKLTIPDQMPRLRQRAQEIVRDHFNHLTGMNIHDDMLAHVHMARGHRKDHPIEERHARKVQILQQIERATTKDAINAVLVEHGMQYTV